MTVVGAGGAGMGGRLLGAGHPVPTGPLYSALLLLHILCAVVGFGAMVLTGIQAARARRGPTAPSADSVRRYFSPGVNWAGRLVYGVPVFGFALIASSSGAFDGGDGFVDIGILVWVVAVVVAEMVVWPGERVLQTEISERWGDPAAAPGIDRACRRLTGASALLALLFLGATVVMVGKP